MRLLIQVVSQASVQIIDKNFENSIGKGYLIYQGISVEDLESYKAKIEKIIYKLKTLKLIDHDDKIDQTLDNIGGEILLISNFSLYGSNKKGTKIDFTKSAPYKQAEKIYDYFIEELGNAGFNVKTGEFGGYMHVSSVNKGPLNYVFDF